MRALVTLILLIALVTAGPAARAESGLSDEGVRPSASAQGAAFEFNARDGFAAERAWLASTTDPAARLIEFRRDRMCGISAGRPSTPSNGNCVADEGVVEMPDCEGAVPLNPLWRRERATAASPWSLWTLAAPASCPQEVLPAFTAEDFRRLPLAPAQVTVQPAASTVLINIPTITMAAAPQQNLTTDLLGYPVEVQATATTYTWDYGDGSAPLVTTSPGHAYPNHDVHHSYARPGTYTITLTTTWSGQYRIAGSTAWLDVDGTATTVTTIPPITAVEQRTALVAEPCTPSTC